MKCACGFKGKFVPLGNVNSANLGMYYILKPKMESKYEGLVELYVCPKCKTVKALTDKEAK